VDKAQETMVKHYYHKLNFKGFIAENAQANWNVVIIIICFYYSKDVNVEMVNKKQTCLFH
jgi:hypothetical protein